MSNLPARQSKQLDRIQGGGLQAPSRPGAARKLSKEVEAAKVAMNQAILQGMVDIVQVQVAAERQRAEVLARATVDGVRVHGAEVIMAQGVGGMGNIAAAFEAANTSPLRAQMLGTMVGPVSDSFGRTFVALSEDVAFGR